MPLDADGQPGISELDRLDQAVIRGPTGSDHAVAELIHALMMVRHDRGARSSDEAGHH